ncbi:MAG TPA: zinc ribbon domain-containing protein [Pyrinomonadaceae bacterium]|jgi:hypothetical protein
MICRNCQAEVDDDLIFCTNCGERLFEPPEDTPTVLMTEPVYTTPNKPKPPKTSSRLKWLALTLALCAIPASIFGVYLLMNSQNNLPVARNSNKPNTPNPTPARRSNTNQNANANTANANRANTNQSANTTNNPSKIEIMNERIEIAPQSHYARPFEVKEETAKFTGKMTISQGEKIDGFVYLKQTYEENFPDETFKMFSFGNSFEVRQTLVKENYVLVFVNNTDKPATILANFSLE